VEATHLPIADIDQALKSSALIYYTTNRLLRKSNEHLRRDQIQDTRKVHGSRIINTICALRLDATTDEREG